MNDPAQRDVSMMAARQLGRTRFSAHTASLKLPFALERTKSMPAECADSCRADLEALMAVKRIVPNIASDQLDKAKSLYAEMLDMTSSWILAGS
jgi:hypothetical protein